MQLQKIIVFALAVLLLSNACNKKYTPATYTKGKQLQWGKGGGFAGNGATYFLLENGQFFYQEKLQADTLFVGKLPKKTRKYFFKQLNKINIDSLQFNHPGNVYGFIGYKAQPEDTLTQSMWGDDKYIMPVSLKPFLDTLIKASRPLMTATQQPKQ